MYERYIRGFFELCHKAYVAKDPEVGYFIKYRNCSRDSIILTFHLPQLGRGQRLRDINC